VRPAVCLAAVGLVFGSGGLGVRALAGHGPPSESPAPLSGAQTPRKSPAGSHADAGVAAVVVQTPGYPPRPRDQHGARARHVLIVSEDGMRPDALLRSNARFHRKLMREGAYSLKAMTIRRASTLPSHAAMLSGFDVPDHGVSWNSWQPKRGFIKVPTILSVAHEHGGGTAAFVGKKKLAHVIHPGVVDVFARPGYLCRKVVEVAARYFVAEHPEVQFVHFSDPDSFGHKSGWMSREQLKAVRRSDRCLQRLVQAVAESPLAENTLVIVSSDHGGRGHRHSGRRLEDRVIPWIAWGPSVRHGHRIQTEINTMDTAATAFWALGHEAPEGLQGKPVTEAFKTN